MQTRVFAYPTERGLVAGALWNIVFTLDAPRAVTWAVFKDWNVWMNAYGFYWPGVIGDMYNREDRDFAPETFRLTIAKPGETAVEVNHYQMLRMIPEHLIMLYEPIRGDNDHGSVSHGTHVYMLSEVEGRTIVTITMEHADRTDAGEKERVEHWRARGREVQRIWSEVFVPHLKALVSQRSDR